MAIVFFKLLASSCDLAEFKFEVGEYGYSHVCTIDGFEIRLERHSQDDGSFRYIEKRARRVSVNECEQIIKGFSHSSNEERKKNAEVFSLVQEKMLDFFKAMSHDDIEIILLMISTITEKEFNANL